MEGALGTLSYLNGLATAVIVGPEAVPAAEWIGCFLEGAEDTGAEGDSLLATIMMVEHGKIVQNLKGRGSYEPHFWEDRDGNLVTRDWAGGFLAGIHLRDEAWKPYLEGKGRVLTAMLCVLLQDKKSKRKSSSRTKTRNGCSKSAQVKITDFIQALYSIRREKVLDSQPPEAKIGRNDPCPCGSGKKYKKCCLN